jgi:hypothetical protein
VNKVTHPDISLLEAEAIQVLKEKYGERVGRIKAASFIRNCRRDKMFFANIDSCTSQKAA